MIIYIYICGEREREYKEGVSTSKFIHKIGQWDVKNFLFKQYHKYFYSFLGGSAPGSEKNLIYYNLYEPRQKFCKFRGPILIIYNLH